jgi:dihydrofolate reductase
LTATALLGRVAQLGPTARRARARTGWLSGEILFAGSFQLLRTLIEDDLVDKLRLKVPPIVLGAGKRLFGEISEKKPQAPR